MATEFLFRDQSFRRIEISISDLEEKMNVHAPGAPFSSYDPIGEVQIAFNAVDESNHYSVILVFRNFLSAYWENFKKDSLASELKKLAKWLVLNGQYRSYDRRKEDSKAKFFISDKADGLISYRVGHDGQFALVHAPLADLPVRESQLTRRAIIHELYVANSLRQSALIMQSHMPQEIALAEFTGLLASKYILLYKSDPERYYLTTDGREYYEKLQRRASGKAFIIASCRAKDSNYAESHKRTLAIYRDVLKDGYEPIFQENEEPWKNIYTDIFDHIDTSELVVADLTWERPNCYVEIGYALARQVPTLLFIEQRYFKRKMNNKLPFDLSPVRVQEYSYDDEGDLREKLEKRVKIWQERKALP